MKAASPGNNTGSKAVSPAAKWNLPSGAGRSRALPSSLHPGKVTAIQGQHSQLDTGSGQLFCEVFKIN
jgi:hypothetical protein